ncbi:MAG: hypothetical protein IJW82_06445 [Clostridia bacterium]|nr:hypothetical protein [Clostridia bacterium]
MSTTLIKELAKNAKLRLTNSNYIGKSKINSSKIITFSPSSLDKKIEFQKIDNSFEDIIKDRIIEILNEDEEPINPLAQLIDYSYFNSLNDDSKQRYILELANIYTETKKSYYNQKLINFN